MKQTANNIKESSKRTFEVLKQYSVGEEIASSVLHGLGVIFGIAGLAVMLVFAGLQGDGFKIAAAIIYGLSIILEYTASTLYHGLTNGKAKRVFKILDHAAIYLLIAGTYTPYCLVTLRNNSGVRFMIIIWSFAAVGIAFEAFWVFRPKWVSVLVYLVMGWMIVFSIGDLVAALPKTGIALLFAGGLAYTVGTVFYVQKKVKYLHPVWHLWVLAGTVLSFFSILLFVIIP
ncbi:MAG: hemolysin III family protein [Coriobacteriia bacterium]|nr:hemolysin III family protein [Coriobacteriia bacterium]